MNKGDIMSFETLKLPELKKIAEDFGVDIEGAKNKKAVIAALAEEGVSWSVYSQASQDVKEAAENLDQEILPRFDHTKEVGEDNVLVRMTRENFRYDIMGFTFTKQHPFVAMTKENAQQIFDKEGGFRLANPKEVQDFYS
jgi:hypothetical protein